MFIKNPLLSTSKQTVNWDPEPYSVLIPIGIHWTLKGSKTVDLFLDPPGSMQGTTALDPTKFYSFTVYVTVFLVYDIVVNFVELWLIINTTYRA